jgi:protein TonB
MFFFTLFKASTLLSIIIVLHAVLVWILLLQPKPVPVKTLAQSVQVSFIQLPKPKTAKIAAPVSKAVAAKPVKQINRKPKPQAKKPASKPYTPKKPRNNPKTNKQTTSKQTTNKPAAHHAKTTSKTPAVNHVKQNQQSDNTNDINDITDSQSQQSQQNTQPIASKKPTQKIQTTAKKPSFNQAYLHQPKPPYTRILRRLNLQGTVTLRVAFAKQGQVQQVSIVNSSGSSRLDNHAMQYVKKHWRYNPPNISQQWTTVVPIRFYLQ